MPQFRAMMERMLADGQIDAQEVEELRAFLYADGKIDRKEAEFLLELHRRIERITPAFERFFYQAIKSHILTDGAIDREEVSWLRSMILADGKVDEREKKLLRELKGEAKSISPEFDQLYAECILS